MGSGEENKPPYAGNTVTFRVSCHQDFQEKCKRIYTKIRTDDLDGLTIVHNGENITIYIII